MKNDLHVIQVPTDSRDVVPVPAGKDSTFIRRVLKSEYRNIIVDTLAGGQGRLSRIGERRLARVVEAVIKLRSMGQGFRFPLTVRDRAGKDWTVSDIAFMRPYFYQAKSDAERKELEREHNERNPGSV